MNSAIRKTQFLMIGVMLLILACSLPRSTEAPQVTGAPTEAQIPDTGSTEPAGEAVEHITVPVELPADRSNHAGDYTSAATRSVTGGDRFTFGQFERPFNANTMDVYYPSLDIVDTFVYQDDLWVYGTIQIQGGEASSSFIRSYGLELDLDRDGKGDWLVVASNPASTDWTVTGVQVFQDSNGDVGNVTAMYTDNNAAGDGFENLVFDQGDGNDPDGAWTRISPDEPNIIEIAVKRSVLGNPESYLINMWAGSAQLDPALFDLNDRFTHEQAGAADRGYEIFYPIKAVAQIDNSCRMAVGFNPTGNEPGLCKTVADEAEGCPPCPQGQYQIPPSCTCYTP